MNAAVGHSAVLLGLVGALVGIATLGWGLARKKPNLLRAGQSYPWLVLLAAAVAAGAMEHALVTRDFSLAYVAQNDGLGTPLLFRITGMWSALQGSLLLWTLILAGYLAAEAWHFAAGPPTRWWPGSPSSAWRSLPSSSGSCCSARPTRSGRSPVRCRPTGRDRTRCSRTTRSSPSTRRCCTWASSASPCRSCSRWPRWSRAGWARAGSSKPGAGRCSPGGSSPRVSCSGRSGPTRCSAGAATGRGTRWRTPRCCRG